MKKDFLKEIPKANKVDFLSKLRSGQFNLIKPYEPQPELNLDLQENGLYLCKETSKEMSQAQIESLPGYRITIALVDTREQVAHQKPPSGFVMVPFSKDEYLASLLKNKNDVVIVFDATDPKKPFKSKDERYSFNDLMTSRNENPSIEFYMDETTKVEYLKALEKWC